MVVGRGQLTHALERYLPSSQQPEHFIPGQTRRSGPPTKRKSLHFHVARTPVTKRFPSSENCSKLLGVSRSEHKRSMGGFMRLAAISLCLLSAAVAAFGQAGAGTITGAVIDPTGAAVAHAQIEVKNTQTGVIYPTV